MGNKVYYWVCRVFGGVTGIGACFFVTMGGHSEKPYDERTYYWVVGGIAMYLCFKFLDWAKNAKEKMKIEKDRQEVK
jgi:hypothetical protein